MLEIWSAASFDATLACATTQVERERDCSRLADLVATRGLGVFTLDLPTLDERLLALLEEGHVSFGGPLEVRRSKLDSRPRFLWEFWSLVCDKDGCLYKDPSVEAMHAIRQLSTMWKKLEVPCSQDRLMRSIDEYFAIEAEMPQPSALWGTGSTDDTEHGLFAHSYRDVRDECSDHGFLVRLDKVAGILVSGIPVFSSMSEDSLVNGFHKHGPGAVANLRGKDYKYSFPNWSAKLEGLFPFDWCSGAGLGEYPDTDIEPASRLLAVPKTAKGPRLIAAEPVEHQWCQQKVKTFLDYHFRHSLVGLFFDPTNQALSQRLVALAARDRSLSTIDLSSASDRVQTTHIECMLRVNPSLLEAAAVSRTTGIEDGMSAYGYQSLRKFASMGSALTFPMQSLFFLCVALASCKADTVGKIRALRGKVRVFGDDIIVPERAYASTVRNLTALGLKVNKNKSFSKGRFRESCGSDCWGDYDITPVKLKTCATDTLLGTQALLDSSNNLFKKGYWRAANTILEMLDTRFTRNVFHHTCDVPGVVSYSGTKVGRIRYDTNLHYHYVRQPTVLKRQERIIQDNSFALREFFTRPYCADRARETGTKRSTTAALAFVRVGTHVLGGAAAFNCSQ
jgi:hypothetical protein